MNVNIKKVRVNSNEEFEEQLSELPSCYILNTYNLISPDTGERKFIEYLEIHAIKNRGENGSVSKDIFIAPNSFLFVMNNDGQTIDSLSCF